MRRLLLLLGVLLSGCTAAPPAEPPSVGGVRPGMQLARAVELLAPGQALPADEEGRRFALQDAEVTCVVGRVMRMRATRLNYGSSELKAGDSETRVRQVLGPPRDPFNRGGEEVWVYELKGCRYDAVFKDGKLERVEIALEPKALPRNPADYGVGTYGSTLRTELRLTVDGVALGMTEAEVNKLKGAPDPRLTGSVKAYSGLATFVEYRPLAVRWVLGRQLLRYDKPWVTAGMPVGQAQQSLAEVGRLKSQSGTAVSYTLLNYGDVRLLVEDDQTVGAVELVSPD